MIMSPIRAAVVRVLAALRAGWRADLLQWHEGEPEVKRKRTSFFDCDPDALHAALPSDPDREEREEFERWERLHFKNWPRRR